MKQSTPTGNASQELAFTLQLAQPERHTETRSLDTPAKPNQTKNEVVLFSDANYQTTKLSKTNFPARSVTTEPKAAVVNSRTTSIRDLTPKGQARRDRVRSLTSRDED